MALKQVKEANEKAISNYLKQGFGENYDIQVSWGYPATQVHLVNDNEDSTVKWIIGYNIETEDFSLSCMGEKKVKDSENKPAWSSIDNKTLNFITDGIQKVVNAIFSGPEDENTSNPNREEEIEKVEAEQVE